MQNIFHEILTMWKDWPYWVTIFATCSLATIGYYTSVTRPAKYTALQTEQADKQARKWEGKLEDVTNLLRDRASSIHQQATPSVPSNVNTNEDSHGQHTNIAEYVNQLLDDIPKREERKMLLEKKNEAEKANADLRAFELSALYRPILNEYVRIAQEFAVELNKKMPYSKTPIAVSSAELPKEMMLSGRERLDGKPHYLSPKNITRLIFPSGADWWFTTYLGWVRYPGLEQQEERLPSIVISRFPFTQNLENQDPSVNADDLITIQILEGGNVKVFPMKKYAGMDFPTVTEEPLSYFKMLLTYYFAHELELDGTPQNQSTSNSLIEILPSSPTRIAQLSGKDISIKATFFDDLQDSNNNWRKYVLVELYLGDKQYYRNALEKFVTFRDGSPFTKIEDDRLRLLEGDRFIIDSNLEFELSKIEFNKFRGQDFSAPDNRIFIRKLN